MCSSDLMRPFGDYSMVDVDAKGGLQVIANELLQAGDRKSVV